MQDGDQDICTTLCRFKYAC